MTSRHTRISLTAELPEHPVGERMRRVASTPHVGREPREIQRGQQQPETVVAQP